MYDEILEDLRDLPEIREKGAGSGRCASPNGLEPLDGGGGVLRMSGENRLINREGGCACTDQAGNFLSGGVREVDGKGLLLAVVLVKGEGSEGQRSGEDRFHRRFRICLRELPFVHEDGLLPRNRTVDHRLAVIRVGVEIPRGAIDLDGGEAAGDVALAVVPRDLAIRHQINSAIVLLPQDRLDDLSLGVSELRGADLSLVESSNRPPQGLLVERVANARIIPDNRGSDQVEPSGQRGRIWIMGIV